MSVLKRGRFASRVTSKYSSLSRVASSKEKFVSFSRLLLSPSSKLSSRQARIVELHSLAVKAFRDFEKTGAYRHEGLTPLSNFPVSPLEQPAVSAGEKVLKHAISYYASHGKIERAFDDLRFMSKRLHPSFREMWADHFLSHLQKLPDVPLPFYKKVSEQSTDEMRRKIERIGESVNRKTQEYVDLFDELDNRETQGRKLD